MQELDSRFPAAVKGWGRFRLTDCFVNFLGVAFCSILGIAVVARLGHGQTLAREASGSATERHYGTNAEQLIPSARESVLHGTSMPVIGRGRSTAKAIP